ncbi:MAG: nucleoside deaminase [Bacteriovoracaceae bacterium]|nr:nucleoside deaminase [Bacteriovoracaceae bacterium]
MLDLTNPDIHFKCMAQALAMAQQAAKQGEVPVGAVIANLQGKIIAQSGNQKESTANPCGHAEILAITQAAHQLQTWRLNGHLIYVSLEPCLMCMAAISQARLDGLIFAAYDAKFGGVALYHQAAWQKKINHRLAIIGGFQQLQSAALLREFFQQKRH